MTVTIKESEEKVDKKDIYREGGKDREWKPLQILYASQIDKRKLY